MPLSATMSGIIRASPPLDPSPTSLAPTPRQVRHYAGEVVYDVRGMLEKNADRLSRNLYNLLNGASNTRTKAIFPTKERTGGCNHM